MRLTSEIAILGLATENGRCRHQARKGHHYGSDNCHDREVQDDFRPLLPATIWQVSECAVADSTRTGIVSPGPIDGVAGNAAVLNCGVFPASMPSPRRARPS